MFNILMVYDLLWLRKKKPSNYQAIGVWDLPENLNLGLCTVFL